MKRALTKKHSMRQTIKSDFFYRKELHAMLGYEL